MIEIDQRIPMKYSVHNYFALEYFKLYFEQRCNRDIYETSLLGSEKL